MCSDDAIPYYLAVIAMKRPKGGPARQSPRAEGAGPEHSEQDCAELRRLREENSSLRAERDRILDAFARLGKELEGLRQAPDVPNRQEAASCEPKQETPVTAWLRGLA